MGWSERGPSPRDGQQIANELHTLLQNASIPAPYVLVGASRGGQYVRLYASLFPDEVSGLVLVDAEPEEIRSRSRFAQSAAQNQGVFSVMGLAARSGIFRLLGALSGEGGDIPEMPCLPWAMRDLPAELHAAYLAVEGQPQCFQAIIAEDTASDAREAQVRAVGSLGDMPLIVLTHGSAAAPSSASTPEGVAEYEQVWQELQQAMAARSSNGLLIVAEESGHNIMLDQPEVVVESVRRVIEQTVIE
jgi:pimeloyl-ACP methyl ester carboxylesterase